MDKISCGGFYIGEGLELEDKVLKATGGGGGGDVHQLTVEKEDGYYVISGEQVKAIVNDRPAIVQAQMGWYEDVGGESIMSTYITEIVSSGDTLIGIGLQALMFMEESQGEWGIFHSSYSIADEQAITMKDGLTDGSDTVQYMFLYDAESNTYKCAIDGE